MKWLNNKRNESLSRGHCELCNNVSRCESCSLLSIKKDSVQSMCYDGFSSKGSAAAADILFTQYRGLQGAHWRFSCMKWLSMRLYWLINALRSPLRHYKCLKISNQWSMKCEEKEVRLVCDEDCSRWPVSLWVHITCLSLSHDSQTSLELFMQQLSQFAIIFFNDLCQSAIHSSLSTFALCR